MRRLRTHLPYLVLIAASPWLVFAPMFRLRTFGPEFPFYFQYNEGCGIIQTLWQYRNLEPSWYRPTAFHLPYWIGEQLLSWYNTAGWQAYEVVTIVGTCFALYWFVLLLAPGARLAAALAAFFFALHPALYAGTITADSFDMAHVFFALLSVGGFIRALRSSGRRRIFELAASWACFCAALTAKEVALAIPVYLAVVCLIPGVTEEGPKARLGRWRWKAWLLIPFFAVYPVYWRLHLARVVARFGDSGNYRARPNAAAILTNLHDLVEWVPRVFYHTARMAGHAAYLDTLTVNAIGVALAALVAAAWWKLARQSVADRANLLLMLAWTGVFLLMPIYSGGFLWHVTLPMAGYAVLFGLGMAAWIDAIPRSLPRYAALAVLLIAIGLLSRANLNAEISSGIHSTGFRLNQSVREHPPVARERLGSHSLVYVEDRLEVGAWSYGCYQWLFNYVYLRHDVEQVVVPRMDLVPNDLRQRWLSHPNAYFFRYDDRFLWYDDSVGFRRLATGGSQVETPRTGEADKGK